MTTPYLTFDQFRLRTVMPPEDVDLVEEKHAGYLVARLKINSSRINSMLSKRYATPFADPPPEIVLGWLDAMTTVDAYTKRGWDPADAQSKIIVDDRDRAFTEMKEAADAQNGLFDLPLREDLTGSGITRGGPLGYSEPDPYEWMRVQDEARRGR